MTIQSIDSIKLPFPNFRHVNLIATHEDCPVVAVGENQSFFVVWRLNHTSHEAQADPSIVIVVWRIRNAKGHRDTMFAQHYQSDGKPLGDLLEVQTFTDVLHASSQYNPSLIFYCSNCA